MDGRKFSCEFFPPIRTLDVRDPMNGSQTHSLSDQLDFQISLLRLVTTAHEEWEERQNAPERELENLRSPEGKRWEG